ncbi:fibulin-1-like isoform X3 [Girardinichthys multiradiatus]|uniref:fibulin-1-like isoform X3 n=1 Tax=Girardinichthys multiradiatus TaxID=208333 RepID=UPI001FAC7A2E|nr:fibulin-1-like isoform X3 [Girardinichthys multiradiatus]
MGPMAHRIVLLLFLCAVLKGIESKLTSVQECCEAGREIALREHDCTVLPRFTSHICSIAQEHCCRAFAKKRACNNGIKMARGKQACERPFFTGSSWETQISEACCDCCTLGLKTDSMGFSCDFQDLQLDKQCSNAARVCCEKPKEINPNAKAPEETEVFATRPPEEANTCRELNCSQLCVDNGRCACNDGFQLQRDGATCGDINECLNGSHNCSAEQVCVNTEGSFYCQLSCHPGFILTDNIICKDIDECTLGSHDCGANYVCINTAGSFYCEPKVVCRDGYRRNAAGNCIDIDECVVLVNPCRPGQSCINTVGSYSCRRNTVTCQRGYHPTVDGTRCEEVDECLITNMCGKHICVNLDGSYRCECRAGYRFSNTTEVCEDVDECLIDNKCGSHVCVNLKGSYRCECRNGYMFNRVTKLCEDINECSHYPGRLCAHKCENTEGSYQCSCATGFKLAYDGRDCEDINECEDKPCSQECTNVYGSYQCYCHRGYQLNDVDGITCEDIDECTLPNVCSYKCRNSPGGFNCTCPTNSYTLALDGRTCQDIDECTAGTHSCSAMETCFNVQGGFRCLFFECPTNFRRAAKGSTGNGSAVLRCVKACQEHDSDCARDPVHIITSTALSLPTFQHLEEPEEIVLLRTATGAKPDLLPDEPDVFFVILATDELNSFDVIKRSQNSMIVGVIRQIKPVMGPKELVLEVTMKYVQSGVVSQQNIVLIHIFVSKFWF